MHLAKPILPSEAIKGQTDIDLVRKLLPKHHSYIFKFEYMCI